MEGSSEPVEAQVGTLGWLGFFIVNVALWGVIAQSSSIAWVFGFTICGLYTGGLYGIAVFVESREDGKARYRNFLNLIWVLICTFVFVLGIFIAIQVIGGEGMHGFNPAFPDSDSDEHSLPSLLPPDASEEARNWAMTGDSGETRAMPIKFADSLYLIGRLEAEEGRQLLRVDADLEITAISSDLDNNMPITEARSFIETPSGLLFFADGNNRSDRDRLFHVAADEPGAAKTAVTTKVLSKLTTGADQPDEETRYPRMISIFQEEGSDQFFLKGSYPCRSLFGFEECWTDVFTIYQIDSSGVGVDLRGDVCTPGCTALQAEGRGEWDGPTKREMWGILLVAVLPMMAVSGLVLSKREMPGPVVNLWAGGQMIGVILFELFEGESLTESGLIASIKEMYFRNDLLLMFFCFYNAAGYAALVLWSLFGGSQPEWKEEAKTWAVFFVGWGSFGLIHQVLAIPFPEATWEWSAYTFLAVVQLALGFVIKRSTPMATGSLGLFIVSIKVAHVMTSNALSFMVVMLVEGSLVIWGASVLAGNSQSPESVHED